MRHSTPAIPAARATAALGTDRTNKVLRNTYILLAITMLPTVIGAFAGALFPLMAHLGFGVGFVVFLVALFGLQAMVIKNRNSASGVGWLLVFTFAMGYFMGPMVGYALGSFSNGAQLVAMAMGGTAAIFFSLAGYAAVTNRDFSSFSFGRTLMIGMVMFFVLSLANTFLFNMPALALAISSMFIVIASGFILFTVNRIVRGGEDNYLLATMTIYVMLLNIFQGLLHLLMAFAGNRD